MNNVVQFKLKPDSDYFVFKEPDLGNISLLVDLKTQIQHTIECFYNRPVEGLKETHEFYILRLLHIASAITSDLFLPFLCSVSTAVRLNKTTDNSYGYSVFINCLPVDRCGENGSKKSAFQLEICYMDLLDGQQIKDTLDPIPASYNPFVHYEDSPVSIHALGSIMEKTHDLAKVNNGSFSLKEEMIAAIPFSPNSAIFVYLVGDRS